LAVRMSMNAEVMRITPPTFGYDAYEFGNS